MFGKKKQEKNVTNESNVNSKASDMTSGSRSTKSATNMPKNSTAKAVSSKSTSAKSVSNKASSAKACGGKGKTSNKATKSCS